MLTIRPATEADSDAVREIFRAVISGGDAFVFEPQTTRAEGLPIGIAGAFRHAKLGYVDAYVVFRSLV